jgi:hypothetical protein
LLKRVVEEAEEAPEAAVEVPAEEKLNATGATRKATQPPFAQNTSPRSMMKADQANGGEQIRNYQAKELHV